MPQPGNGRDPDPTIGSAGSSTSHRRYSSTDSLEGSINSSHSRQGSDSNETGYPSRRMSTQMTRRQSQGDPLQFIKGKPSTELAELAESQIKVAAESKKVAISTASLLGEDDDSSIWQANLSTWKSRRKSQSEKSYQMKEEREKMEKEKEGVEESSAPPVTKTFSQMQEERERRKSVGRRFYPIEDEEEDDIFSFNTNENDKKKTAEEIMTMTHKPLAEIAPWARDDPEVERNNKHNEEEEEETSDSEEEEEQTENNNNKKDNDKSSFTDNNSSLTKYSSLNAKEADRKQNDISRVDSRNRSYVSQQRSFKSTNSSQDIINRSESFKGVGPRTQNKIGSIMQNFHDSQTSSSAPKQGYNEKIDLKARMKSFQSNESENDTLPSVQQTSSNKVLNSNRDKFNNYRNSFNQSENDSSSSHITVSHQIRERSKSSSSDTKRKSADKSSSKLVEKTVKIRQKPNDDRGFGFILTGGTDQDKPLTVSRVTLGSGADVCNLKVKDEIVCINHTDVTDKTSMEVGDMVAKGVEKGFIELKVHRERSQDDFSDEERMTSSSDEGEEDLGLQDDQPSSAKVEKVFKHTDAKEQDQVKEVREEIQAVHIKREQSIPTDLLPPPPPEFTEPYKSMPEVSADDEDDDGGPPAILRKWQRQRQRNEYAFDNGPSSLDSESPVYKKISLNAPIPKRDSEYAGDEKDETKWRASRPWDERQKEWINQQDKERIPDRTKGQNDIPSEQAKFDARQIEMKEQFEESLKEAEERIEEKSRQEQAFLQPELDKARILEERRLERRNRIQESAAAAASPQVPAPTPSSLSSKSSYLEQAMSSSSAPLQQASFNMNIPEKQPTAQNVSHVSSMTFNIESKEKAAPNTFNIPKQTGNGVIVIDPRNRSGAVQGVPVEFQVKLAPKPDDGKVDFEEKERQRIKDLEEEKMKKIKDKERQLQEQEELLRQERERFYKEQEEFRERQLQLQQQQQQQQQQQHQPPQQQRQQQHQQSYTPSPHQGLYHPQQFQPHPLIQEQEYSYSNQHQNYSSPHSTSHLAMQSSSPSPQVNSVSTVQLPPSSSISSSSYYTNTAKFPPPPVSTKPKWPPQSQNQREEARSYNNPLFTKSVNTSSYASVQPQFSININSSNRVQNSPSPNNDFDGRNNNRDRDRTDAPKSGKFSQEEILAMNKKPFQESIVASRVNQVENQANFSKQPSQSRPADPQNRMPSSYNKEQMAAMNRSQNQSIPSSSAPKARFRNDNEWKDPARNQPQTSSQRRDGNVPPVRKDGNVPPARKQAYSSPQEHWLVQEAERRRVSDQNPDSRVSYSQSGPIKPLPDINNKWKENRDRNNEGNSESMPHAIRQTLLQRTAGVRSPDETGYINDDNNNDSLLPPPNMQYPLQQQQYLQIQSNRSVSPRGGNGYSQHQNYDPRAGGQQQSYSPSDMSNKYNVNPIHQIQQPAPQTINRSTPPVPPPPSSLGYNPGSRAFPGRENGLPVNGSQLCSHCNQELGYGAAMVIESLGIFFHLNCFRCCVCHASLGTGAQGADVRVRMNKLHCQNCYSNDEGHKPRNYASQKIWIEV